jgi:hypothetical protein
MATDPTALPGTAIVNAEATKYAANLPPQDEPNPIVGAQATAGDHITLIAPTPAPDFDGMKLTPADVAFAADLESRGMATHLQNPQQRAAGGK